MYVYGVALHLVVLYMWKLKHLIRFRVGVYHRTEKKYKKCLRKLCFKEQFQADSFSVEFIFILLSNISQGDS